MSGIPRAAAVGLSVALLLLFSTGVFGRFLALHDAARAARESARRERDLRSALVSRYLNLRHFPAGVYAGGETATGEAGLAPFCRAWFDSPTGELADLYRGIPLPAEGAWAMKLLLRENGRIDFTTRGLLRGGSEEERALVSARICTQINENPRISLHASDPEARVVHEAIFKILKAAAAFRDEEVAVVDRPDTPPLILVEEEGRTFAELGEWRIRFAREGKSLRVTGVERAEGFSAEDADTGEVAAESPAPVSTGDLARSLTVKRAMVNDSVVGTVIPWRARGFVGPVDLLVGIDNTERITGIVVERHREPILPARRVLDDGTEFLTQFDGLLVNDVALKNDGRGVVDAVTGATRTCRGVVNAVREALRFNETMNLEEYGSEE